MYKYFVTAVCTVGLLAIIASSFPFAQAAQLQNRNIQISTSRPGAAASHQFNFTIPSVNTIGSIELEYCSNSPFLGTACTAPAGLSLSAATLASQTGETGFSISGISTANRIVLTRPAALTSAVAASYRFAGVINPTTVNEPVYVRIGTYASTDATGAFTDDGAVVFTANNGVTVSAFVPPYLTFCVGVTVALNCSTTNGFNLNFGELSKAQTKFLTSQFSVATNDVAGHAVTVDGTTMTSGNNVITALTPAQSSQTGVGQFGMNLRSNTQPFVGAEPAGVGTASISSSYASPNNYYFNPGVVASSPNSTEYNLFTISYIVNIGNNQPPGVYVTTLTYIASAAF